MLPSVTTILSDGGVGFDMSHLPEEYSIRGTLIHDYAHKRILGCELPQIPEKWRGYAEAADRFQDDIKPEPIMVDGKWLMEAELSHPYMAFVGHPDLPAMDGLMPTIYDYKTGSIPAYAGEQLAGYELLLRTVLPHIKRWMRVAVLLQENGKYKLKEYTEDRDRAEFLEAYYGYMERRGVTWSHRG
jgi:hypothetical protein